jgi:hypothetical protein
MPSKTTTNPITEAQERLAAVQAEQRSLDVREPQLNARLEAILLRDLPVAKTAHDLALATANPADDHATATAVQRLELERDNCESALRGIAARRQQLTQEEAQARTAVERARARAALPAPGTGEITEEAFEEAFGHLGQLVANGVRQAVSHLNRNDQHGVILAFDESELAKWIWSNCAAAGVDLDKAKFVARGTGVGPDETLQNVRAVVETLR